MSRERLRRARDLLTTRPSQRRLVRAASATLDAREPRWYRRVDLPSLDMNDRDRCVLGQLYADYARGLDLLYGHRSALLRPREAAAFGAFFPRRLWVAEVRARVASEKAVARAFVAAFDAALPADDRDLTAVTR